MRVDEGHEDKGKVVGKRRKTPDHGSKLETTITILVFILHAMARL